ncbi:MAG: hypothetical protein V3T17_04955 [Pseudomonadales bacterium]
MLKIKCFCAFLEDRVVTLRVSLKKCKSALFSVHWASAVGSTDLFRFNHNQLHLLLSLFLCLTVVEVLEVRSDELELLDESQYRGELEEVVVIGKEPVWRSEEKIEEWRPDRFKLSKQSSASRIQWFPEYTKDERDNYDGVRDRTGEKPELQIFKWKF